MVSQYAADWATTFASWMQSVIDRVEKGENNAFSFLSTPRRGVVSAMTQGLLLEFREEVVVAAAVAEN